MYLFAHLKLCSLSQFQSNENCDMTRPSKISNNTSSNQQKGEKVNTHITMPPDNFLSYWEAAMCEQTCRPVSTNYEYKWILALLKKMSESNTIIKKIYQRIIMIFFTNTLMLSIVINLISVGEMLLILINSLLAYSIATESSLLPSEEMVRDFVWAKSAVETFCFSHLKCPCSQVA